MLQDKKVPFPSTEDWLIPTVKPVMLLSPSLTSIRSSMFTDWMAMIEANATVTVVLVETTCKRSWLQCELRAVSAP